MIICPHCDAGKLIKKEGKAIDWYHPNGYYDCENCGRGWAVQSDGCSMVSEGATDKEIFYPKTQTLIPYKRGE